MEKELKDLKAGDEVVYEPYRGVPRIAKVERTTKTLLIVKNQRFNHSGTATWQSIYTSPTIRPASPKALADMKKQIEWDEASRKRKNAIKSIKDNIDSLSTKKLEKIVAIIEE